MSFKAKRELVKSYRKKFGDYPFIFHLETDEAMEKMKTAIATNTPMPNEDEVLGSKDRRVVI